MSSQTVPLSARVRAALARGSGLFAFWLLLARPEGGDPFAVAWPGLLVGLFATVIATWASLRLLPAGPARIRYRVLPKIVGRFLWQSMVAGFDVARRAFDPRLPLAPGYLRYPVRIPEGPARAAFGAYTSLMPGALPVGTDHDGALVYHCLDRTLPVAEGLRRDEVLMTRVQGREPARD